jgi:hypothetical protein
MECRIGLGRVLVWFIKLIMKLLFMALNLDLRVVAVASIIVGLFAGYYVSSNIVNKPVIQELNTQIDSRLSEIEGLQSDISRIESDHESLESIYDELVNTGSSEISTLEEEISVLEDQVTYLSESFDTLTEDYDDLEEDYLSTISELVKLMTKYNKIYNPSYVAFTVNDYMINLTLSELSYTDNVPIEGAVSIRHLNGDPFEGTFHLKMTKNVVGAGTLSENYEIMGETDYDWVSPFALGAGSYKLSIGQIQDSEGHEVISGGSLRPYFVNIFMG